LSIGEAVVMSCIVARYRRGMRLYPRLGELFGGADVECCDRF
jgi:hypothetical protein